MRAAAAELVDYEIDRDYIQQALTLLHHPEVGPDRQIIRLLEKLRATSTPIAIGRPKTIDARAVLPQVEGALPAQPDPASFATWPDLAHDVRSDDERTVRGSVRFDDGRLCVDATPRSAWSAYSRWSPPPCPAA